jgi:hypothetical protein
VNTDDLAPHQRRVVQELNELVARIGKLGAYVQNGCPGATRPEAALLDKQFSLMCQYRDVLQDRLGLWVAD